MTTHLRGRGQQNEHIEHINRRSTSKKQTTNTSTCTPNFPMKKCISISFFLLNLALQQSNVCAFSTPSSRQDFMRQLATGVASVALLPQIANAAVLRSDKCAYGEGGGCDSLAGDNELIKELQRRSSEKKEATQKVRVMSMF